METIIIWIVIVAVGAVFEWVKKKSASQEGGQSRPGSISRPAPCNTTWSVPTTDVDMTSKPQPQPQPQPRQTKAAKPAPAPAHAYQPLANLSQNDDTPLQVEVLDDSDETAPVSPTREHDLRTAHYDRWRKAILDTQILERKF